ncbi:MAG: DUF1553 domain-containing protein [Verrucomicrobiaceae bacterium]|nr:DUF1553 domain-containing protein [Verrucomicrobiaceae bacterium]
MKPSRSIYFFTACVAGIACAVSFFESAHGRTWTSVDGRKLEAEFINTKGGKLLLRRDADRQGFALDLDKVSEADRKWVKEQMEGNDERAGRNWWSLQPITKKDPPAAGNADWGSNEIDAFILARLKQEKLSPSPRATARAQVRRLYFDLTGMPPSPEEVIAFGKDPSDTAYLAIVDKLLASSHYGERWGRHWLDIARFGESDGFERNAPRNNLWPFRDWVIKALNADMPYDEFARMQVAGDLIKPGVEGKSAVAFLAAGLHNTTVGGSEFMKKTARQDELEEIAGAVGQTFFGLTVNCARCHDHKYDPITQKEYYRLTSALGGVYHGDQQVRVIVDADKLAVAQEALKGTEDKLVAIDREAREKVLKSRKGAPDKAQPQVPKPFAQWEFEGDLRDSLGKLHGEASGGARVENGALVVNGNDAFVRTSPIAKDVTEKTLEAWVLIDGLDQRGGGVIGLQTTNGTNFDGIVYGERTPRAWMSGSETFKRSQVHGGPAESEADKKPVHVAIVYHADGRITRYRNGVEYDQTYKAGLAKFNKGGSQFIFGMRHGTGPGNARMLKGRILRAQFYDRALAPDAVAASAGVESSFISEKQMLAALDAGQREERTRLKAEADKLRGEIKGYNSSGKQTIYTVAARGNPGVTRLLNRGHALQPKEEVYPGSINAVSGISADFKIDKNAPDSERRKKLAEWITNPGNPLFTRVIVNRLWHHHFGTGLVKTPNDLGYSGGIPSHPELLDWLAVKLKEEGYHLKAMHRIMVTSSAYRQASSPNAVAIAADAGNRLLWRKSPVRLDAESLRDAMLKVSGKLNTRMGGPGFRDVTHRSLDGTTYYTPIDKEDAELNRRTVYRFSPRGRRSAILDAFDCPDPSTAAPSRSVTTTPLQALSLMNNAFVLRMAGGFATGIETQANGDVAKQVELVYSLAYGRVPDVEEKKQAGQLVSKHGLSALCRVLFNSNEFVVIE